MLRKLIREESGMAMALAMMMMVLIGVMGAGLLIFVSTDLGSVIESNQGQTALNLADAGVQVAKSHMLQTDALYLDYNGTTNASVTPPDPADSPWSCGVWDTTTKTCGAVGKLLDIDTNHNPVRVWIQYLKRALTDAQANDANGEYAPEKVPAGQTNYPVGQDYFKVISQATVGQTKRKIEAIYNTNANSLGTPRGVYTPGNINLNGGAGHVSNMSLFAGGNITGVSDFVRGVDYAYGNWNTPPNTTPRSNPGTCTNPLDASAPSGPCAGLGALGTIENKVSGRDFDSTTCPKFVSSLAAPSSCVSPSTMTFPFNATTPDLDTLRYAAQSQQNGIGGDNYYESSTSTRVVGAASGETRPVWPTNNKASTVVYVKFTSTNKTLTWDVGNNCSTAPVRGTLVVQNGQFTTSPNKTPLRGLVIVSGTGIPDPSYSDTGSTCMEAFISSSGNIKISGNVGSGTQERGSIPSSYGLKLVSWRELYQ